MENKFKQYGVSGETAMLLDDRTFSISDCKEYVSKYGRYGDQEPIHVIEIAAVEQLKAENASLKFQLLDRTEKYTIAMDKGVLELGDKISALKSKLKIASAALEVVKVHNGINAHYPIVYATVTQALRDVGEG